MAINAILNLIQRHACERPFNLGLVYFGISSLIALVSFLFAIRTYLQVDADALKGFTEGGNLNAYQLGLIAMNSLAVGFLVIPAALLISHSYNYGIYRLSKGMKNSYWDVLRITILSFIAGAVLTIAILAAVLFLYWFAFKLNLCESPQGVLGNIIVLIYCSYIWSIITLIIYLLALKVIKGVRLLRFIFLPILLWILLIGVILLSYYLITKYTSPPSFLFNI